MHVETVPFTDIELCEELSALGGWETRYTQLRPGRHGGSYSLTSLGEVGVHVERHSTAVHISASSPSDRIAFQFLHPQVAPGSILGHAMDRPLLIVTERSELEFVSRGPWQAVTLHVPRPALAAALAALGCGETRLRVSVLQTIRIELGELQELAALAALALHAATGEQERKRFETALVSKLAKALAKHQAAGVLPTAAVRSSRSAVSYFEEHFPGSLRMDDLSRATGLSERTLQRSFRAHLGLTPVEYLRLVRLRAVRRALRKAGQGDTVTEIALGHGFAHLGHFGQAYRRMFGECPSATLRHAIEASSSGPRPVSDSQPLDRGLRIFEIHRENDDCLLSRFA